MRSLETLLNTRFALRMHLALLALLPVGMIALSAMGVDRFGLVALSMLTIPIGLLVSALWLALPAARAHISHPLRWLLPASSLLLMLSIPVTLWPLRLVFALERPRLEAFVQRQPQGAVAARPQHFGPLRVGKTDRIGASAVILWLDDGGNHGLLYDPRNVAANFMGAGTRIALTKQWHLAAED